MIFVSLWFSPYPFVCGEIWVMGFALALVLAGMTVEVFLCRKTKKTFLLPALCLIVEVGLEMLYQLAQFRLIHIMDGHEVWDYIAFGVAMLYVLLGTLLGWAVHRMLIRRRRV